MATELVESGERKKEKEEQRGAEEGANLIPLVTHPWAAAIAVDVSTHARGTERYGDEQRTPYPEKTEFKSKIIIVCYIDLVIYTVSLTLWPCRPTYTKRTRYSIISRLRFPAFRFHVDDLHSGLPAAVASMEACRWRDGAAATGSKFWA